MLLKLISFKRPSSIPQCKYRFTTMKDVTFIASYALRDHPAIRNRLLAYMSEGARQGYSIRLVSPDHDIPKIEPNANLQLIPIAEKTGHRSNFWRRAISESITACRALYAARSY